jgi:hypothetical protein
MWPRQRRRSSYTEQRRPKRSAGSASTAARRACSSSRACPGPPMQRDSAAFIAFPTENVLSTAAGTFNIAYGCGACAQQPVTAAFGPGQVRRDDEVHPRPLPAPVARVERQRRPRGQRVPELPLPVRSDPQCSDMPYEVHRSHRWKVHRNHRNGVPWHPLSYETAGHSYENRSQIRALRAWMLEPFRHTSLCIFYQ